MVKFLLLALLLVFVTCQGRIIDGEDTFATENKGIDQKSELMNALGDVEGAFKEFMVKFSRRHSGDEYKKRLAIFKMNLAKAVENQLFDPTAVHGITMFSDLTENEFAKQYLGLKAPKRFHETPTAPHLPSSDLPNDFDWREKGAVTEVKNQGVCGSCYAFSTVGAVEGAHFLRTGDLISLSEQQIVDCDRQCDPDAPDVCDAGCGGGLMNNALQYIETAGGLEKEKDYKYTGSENKCKFNKDLIAANVSNFASVSVDEDQIAANLVKNGPLAVGINAAWMQTYVRGVSCPLVCNKRALDHGVLLVGYGKAGFSPARLKDKPYWIIKNSWGKFWGEHGYYKICRGKDECGMNAMISTVLAHTAEVDYRNAGNIMDA